MQELLCSIHNYTKFSGNGISFYDMAQAALSCGLDVVFTTDRNIYPAGYDQYYYKDLQRVLMLSGEELFDPINPEKPHYLSLGTGLEQFNRNIAASRDEIRILLAKPENNGNFRHFELINAQELLYRGLEPGLKAINSNINAYENLLMNDFKAIMTAGTFSSEFPTKHTCRELFSTACNHLLTDENFTGDMIHDKLLALRAIKNGNLFAAIDGLSDAKGFRFTAEGDDQSFSIRPGDTVTLKNSITFKISIPESCTCRLIRNGKIIKEWQQCRQVPYTIYEPGYYRVECALIRRRSLCSWIYTNPIYVRRG